MDFWYTSVFSSNSVLKIKPKNTYWLMNNINFLFPKAFSAEMTCSQSQFYLG